MTSLYYCFQFNTCTALEQKTKEIENFCLTKKNSLTHCSTRQQKSGISLGPPRFKGSEWLRLILIQCDACKPLALRDRNDPNDVNHTFTYF